METLLYLQTASHVLKLKPLSNDVQIGPLMDRSVLRSEVTKDRSGCNSIRLLCILQQVDVDDIPVLSSTVNVVQSARDLGVILDSQLSLCDHTAAICRVICISSDRSDHLFSHLLLLLKLSFRRSLLSARLVQLTALWCAGEPAEEGTAVGAERLPLVYLLTHGAVTTSLRCCDSFIGCRSS